MIVSISSLRATSESVSKQLIRLFAISILTAFPLLSFGQEIDCAKRPESKQCRGVGGVDLIDKDKLENLIQSAGDPRKVELLELLKELQSQFESRVERIKDIDQEYLHFKSRAELTSGKLNQALALEARCRGEREVVYSARNKFGASPSRFQMKELKKMESSANKCFKNQRYFVEIMLEEMGEANYALQEMEGWEDILSFHEVQLESLEERIRGAQGILELIDNTGYLAEGDPALNLDELRSVPKQ